MQKDIILFLTVLWIIFSVAEIAGQDYPIRNGRHLRNYNSSVQHLPGLHSNSPIYFNNRVINSRIELVNYNIPKKQNSNHVMLNTPKPFFLSHVEVGRNNNAIRSFNSGAWNILNKNRGSTIQQRAKDPRKRKCSFPDDGKRAECARKIKRRKVQNGGSANERLLQHNNFRIIENIRPSNISPTPKLNISQSTNNDKSNTAISSNNDNTLSRKMNSNPCSCYWQQEQCGCDCEGTMHYDDFQDVTRSFFSCQKFTFTMANGEYYALPPNFFSKVKSVEDFDLLITNSTFEYMCDPTPLTSPFNGVIFEKSAKIKLTNVNVRRGWNWTPFKQLKSSSGAQMNVTLENCQLRRLTSDFANLAGGHVDTIDIYNSDLQMVGSNAFRTFENMTRFRIPRNKIQHLWRTDFPELLINLEEIDLRNNEISYLDNDLFTNMPSLKEIMLAGNPIRVLPEATFKPVISKVQLVGITDISLTCDCRLQWLKDSMKHDNRKEKNMKGAICRRPSYLRGMPFEFLSKEHLVCS